MGCSHSIANDHPTKFKAKNLNEKDKSVNSVFIEVQNKKIVVHSRNNKEMASWPISCLRRYGCTQDLLFIEAGSGCDTGQGMYLFKCTRTDQVFELLKQKWNDIQQEHERNMSSGAQLMQFTTIPPQTVITPHNNKYYNTNNTNNSDRHMSSNGSNGSNYANGSVQGFASLSSPHQTPGPNTPLPRGSTSSQRATALESLPEDAALRLDGPAQPFPLQPAPTCRQEMVKRRRINSDMVASYNRNTDRVTIQNTQRHNSESANYENNDVIDAHSNSYPRRHHVTYNSRTQQAQISADQSTSTTPESGETKRGDSTTLSPDVIDSVSRDVSTMSLRSDCEPLLTPGSNGTSGIGSLNGNGCTLSSTQNPPPVPPHPPVTSLVGDPWKKQSNFPHNRFIHHHHHHPHHRMSPNYPQSACEYVNTVNASMDVSGTPLPATAKAMGTHFSFDFDHLLPRSRHQHDRYKLNYVPVEAFSSLENDFNCGASSASSGIPGTPRTPKTPKTPIQSHPSTDYALIDHAKTRALSNIHKARQRERKSRHESTEAGLMNGV
uniref:Fibroblast growth factor receptor substrate 3 n=1 Tax=Phallusia mammillata TaxID=59560 RepID=A0A6F9DDR5_9ASCI|nr:fibroblast growth factor receptor substrate 3 [Phallusia mammillata]